MAHKIGLGMLVKVPVIAGVNLMQREGLDSPYKT